MIFTISISLKYYLDFIVFNNLDKQLLEILFLLIFLNNSINIFKKHNDIQLF